MSNFFTPFTPGTAPPVTFTPHGFCLFWDIKLLTVFIVSNALIALSYFAIPAQLLYMQWRGQSSMRTWKNLLFCGFISSCGVSHIINIVTIWYAWYWIQAIVDLWTGVISYFTACMLSLAIIEMSRVIEGKPAQVEEDK